MSNVSMDDIDSSRDMEKGDADQELSIWKTPEVTIHDDPYLEMNLETVDPSISLWTEDKPEVRHHDATGAVKRTFEADVTLCQKDISTDDPEPHSPHPEDLESCSSDSFVSLVLTTAEDSTFSNTAIDERRTENRRLSRKTIRNLLMLSIRGIFIVWCLVLIAYTCVVFFLPTFILEITITLATIDVVLTILNIAYDKVCRQTSAYISYIVLLVLTIYISSIYGVLAYHHISQTFMLLSSLAFVGVLILCGVFTHVRVYLVYKSDTSARIRWMNGLLGYS